MDIIIKQLTLNVSVGDASVAESIFTQLTQINKKVDQIMATEQQVLSALQDIDTATTAIGDNVNAVATTIAQVANVGSQIDTEVKALLAQLSNQGLPDSVLQAVSAIGAKAAIVQSSSQAASVALAAQKTALDAIASEGVANPVPVPVPPPPPPAVG